MLWLLPLRARAPTRDWDGNNTFTVTFDFLLRLSLARKPERSVLLDSAPALLSRLRRFRRV